MTISLPGFSRVPIHGLAWLLLVFAGAGCGTGGGGGEDAPADGSAEVDASDEEIPLAEQGTYLHIVAPSVVALGSPVEVRMRVITQGGLPNYDFEGAFRFETSSQKAQFEGLTVEPMQEGFFRVRGISFNEPGVQFLRGLAPEDSVQALANAIYVTDDPEYLVFWGDLNGHSDLSSGVKAPGVYFWYAHAVSLLDFAALTDNDREETAQKVLDDAGFHDVVEVVNEDYQTDGEFIGLAGFEWTSREHGNRLVIFGDAPESLPTVAAGYDTPAKLRDALPEGAVVIVAHPAGSEKNPPVDPATVGSEDLLEVYSTVGAFEAPGSPRPTTRETPGAYVQDLLRGGARAGVAATSDTRLSMPGNPRGVTLEDHPYPAGLTAILAKELTREAILDALRHRRCYATTGARYLMEFTVDGHVMGSEVRVPAGHVAKVYGSLGSTTRWVRLEILGANGPVAVLEGESAGSDVVELEAETDPVSEPTFVYLRGIDELGGMAWSSPVFLIPE